MIADNLIWDAVKQSSVCREGASEEDPVVRNVDESGTGEYTVCWDPLDGSSIVDNNWAVGTMMGIWPKRTGLIGACGRDQVTSLVAIYGPRTTVLVALDDGTYEFTYGCIPGGSEGDGGSWTPWICTRHKVRIKPDSKIFSPANLRSAQDIPGYKKLVDYFLEKRYTLRYTGGLVPDVYQQVRRSEGLELAFACCHLSLLLTSFAVHQRTGHIRESNMFLQSSETTTCFRGCSIRLTRRKSRWKDIRWCNRWIDPRCRNFSC